MTTVTANKSLAASLNRPVANRRFGLLISLAVSVLIVVLTLPFIDWINIGNAS